MAIDTYANLQTTIADFLNRTDLTAAIPGFITLAEAQMVRRLLKDGPVRRMMGRSDATISTEFAGVPTDFLGYRAFMMTDTPTIMLELVEPEQITKLKSRNTQLTGQPQKVAVVGSEFQFYPAPDGPYSAELTYWKRIPSLSNSVTTNWVLQYYPDAYLYGALLQSAPYLHDDGRVDMWSAAYATVLDDMVQADKIERGAPYHSLNPVPNGTYDGMSNLWGWDYSA